MWSGVLSPRRDRPRPSATVRDRPRPSAATRLPRRSAGLDRRPHRFAGVGVFPNRSLARRGTATGDLPGGTCKARLGTYSVSLGAHTWSTPVAPAILAT